MESTTTALLYINGVNVSFDGFRALDNLSLAIEPGEMRAIIGPNGAGKTTMMDVVTGKTRPDGGEVYFDGTFDIHFAAVRSGLTGDDIHHRGLAGAVRADDRPHLAGLDRERKIVERAEAVE